MRRVLLLLTLIGCHHDKAAKSPEPPAAPVERSMSVMAGVPIAVTVVGPDTAAHTLIVVTGGPGLSHDYASPLGAIASADLRVVFFDQRATGKSGRPAAGADGKLDPADFTLDVHDTEIEAIRTALHLEKFDLLGHSWGSMIVQHYAVAHPDHVASLIVLNGMPATGAAFDGGYQLSEKRQGELVTQGLIPKDIPQSTADGDCSSVAAILPAYYADPKFPPGKHMSRLTCHKLFGPTFATIDEKYDNRPALAKLTVRSLVMTGEGDLFGTGWADDLAAAIPGAKKVIVPKCGHLMWDECPDALFGELRAFLK